MGSYDNDFGLHEHEQTLFMLNAVCSLENQK